MNYLIYVCRIAISGKMNSGKSSLAVQLMDNLGILFNKPKTNSIEIILSSEDIKTKDDLQKVNSKHAVN